MLVQLDLWSSFSAEAVLVLSWFKKVKQARVQKMATESFAELWEIMDALYNKLIASYILFLLSFENHLMIEFIMMNY